MMLTIHFPAQLSIQQALSRNKVTTFLTVKYYDFFLPPPTLPPNVGKAQKLILIIGDPVTEDPSYYFPLQI
jgi:hypothetical protein